MELRRARNPKAALHFGFDDTPNNHENSFYASFMGLASVHTDAATSPEHKSLRLPDRLAQFEAAHRF